MKSEHAVVLNALDVMQGSVAYAARRDILQQAECIIVSQENTLAEKERLLEQQRTATYQAVEREHAVKKLLSETERELVKAREDVRRYERDWLEATDQVLKLRADLAEKEREIEGLTKKVENLTAWYDKMFGTPCEEIRHQQQVEQLQADLDQAKGAVRRFVCGEDKLCLVCGAKEPCELKNDQLSPCTFEPTPMELHKECQRLRKDLDQVVEAAVKFAEWLYWEHHFAKITRDDVKKFMASPLVQSWQARQQEGKG